MFFRNLILSIGFVVQVTSAHASSHLTRNIVRSCGKGKNSVFVYCDTFAENNRVTGNPNLLFERFKKKVHRNYPDARCALVRADSLTGLKEQFDHLLHPSESIFGLYCDGHGTSSVIEDVDGNPTHVSVCVFVGDERLEFIRPIGGNPSLSKPFTYTRGNIEGSKIKIDRINFDEIEERNAKSRAVLVGIHKRFNSGSRSLFYCCNLFEGEQELARLKAEALIEGFGLEEGSIYANENAGARISDCLTQFFWQQEGLGNQVSFLYQQSWVAFFASVFYSHAPLLEMSVLPRSALAFIFGYLTTYAKLSAEYSTLNSGYSFQIQNGLVNAGSSSKVQKYERFFYSKE